MTSVINMAGFDARFHIPSNLLAVGPTSCGKTTWLTHLVENKNHFFTTIPKSLFIFYKGMAKEIRRHEKNNEERQRQGRGHKQGDFF